MKCLEYMTLEQIQLGFQRLQSRASVISEVLDSDINDPGYTVTSYCVHDVWREKLGRHILTTFNKRGIRFVTSWNRTCCRNVTKIKQNQRCFCGTTRKTRKKKLKTKNYKKSKGKCNPRVQNKFSFKNHNTSQCWLKIFHVFLLMIRKYTTTVNPFQLKKKTQ